MIAGEVLVCVFPRLQKQKQYSTPNIYEINDWFLLCECVCVCVCVCSKRVLCFVWDFSTFSALSPSYLRKMSQVSSRSLSAFQLVRRVKKTQVMPATKLASSF